MHRIVMAVALLASLSAGCGSSSSSSAPPAPVPAMWIVPDDATSLTAPQQAAFLAGQVYLNAHTQANPNGEIRGQLDKGGTVKFATLTGAQETPANASTGYGAGVLSVDTVTGAVRGFVVTFGLVDANLAHVHPGARGIANGPIVSLVSVPGSPDLWIVPDGAANLTAPQITQFQNGELYFNVHTAANPNGEIRGQIDKGGTVRIASLTAAQETPPTTSTAFGTAVFGVDEVSGAIRGFMLTSGLVNSTVGHIHPGARGTSAGPIVPLSGGNGSNLWVVPDAAADLTAPQIALFLSGGLYANAHTTANPNGEIRGQLDKSGTARIAALDGTQETPATGSAALGAGILSVDGTSGDVRGFIVTRGLANPTIAHAHQAARGTSAGPMVSMTGP